jgi:cellobiose phosphorylase
MDLVGRGGKGESVWLAWFLYANLRGFADLAAAREDAAFADRCTEEAERLRQNIEAHGWDGRWYRRAYFDDGTPLGTASAEECRIDSISQSWATLSGGGDSARARTAMKAVDELLVNPEAGLLALLAPPFDKSPLEPGYIKGYAPGVRENGGQYTHAAIWAAMARAGMGDASRAWELASMLNPVKRTADAAGAAVYKVDPYVMAGDIYTAPLHLGRGGWSWYTGASGWMYRLIVESLLGVTLKGDELSVAPLMPDDWESYTIHYRHGSSLYHVVVKRGGGGAGADEPRSVRLIDDGAEHVVEITPTSLRS